MVSNIKIYTDEDVDIAVCKALRLRNVDAFTTLESGNSGNTDDEQLKFANSIEAAILTHNISDFAPLHYESISKNKQHFGIVVAKQYNVGDLVKRILRLVSKLSAADMKNRLEYLSNW